ncbi:MAG TPA: DUF3108 domain-containing protein [Rubrivivax sp.]|nr:DUF3108 domain-containing protein [Rubrivivax sp.]
MNALRTRRRRALLVLALAVGLAHWALTEWLPLPRVGDAAAERMPPRIEVAFVRELAPAAPPPVVVRQAPAARPLQRRKAAPKPAAPASAPQADEATALAQAPPPPPPESASSPLHSPPLEGSQEPEPPAPSELAAAAQPPETPASVPQPAVEAVDAAAVAAAASAAASAAAFEWPPSTRLSYKLHGNYRGEVVGAAQVEWLRVGTRYQVHLDVWVGAQAAPLVGRRMSSDGELTGSGLSPRRYDEETRALFRELRRRTIVFDGDRVLLSNGQQLERIDGMQDAASQFVQLTWLFTTQPQLLRVGQRIEIPLALPGTADRWSYEVVEQATLDTPVGPLPTFHLRPRRELRPNRDLVADAWFAPSLQYLPVRLLIRQDEDTYVDLMLERLPQQEAAAAPPAAAASAAPR